MWDAHQHLTESKRETRIGDMLSANKVSWRNGAHFTNLKIQKRCCLSAVRLKQVGHVTQLTSYHTAVSNRKKPSKTRNFAWILDAKSHFSRLLQFRVTNQFPLIRQYLQISMSLKHEYRLESKQSFGSCKVFEFEMRIFRHMYIVRSRTIQVGQLSTKQKYRST